MKIVLFAVSFGIALLLFAVQPLSSKLALPILGGTPAVWNTVMFTFQFLLLAGYVYAHLLTRLASVRRQVLVHLILVLASVCFLPLSLTIETSDSLMEKPARHLVVAFLTQLGLPFLCLSATAPLLQSWLSRSSHPLSQSPYVLYSASNLGSFAGLIGYILLIEPMLDLPMQRMAWSGAVVIGLTGLLIVGWRLAQNARPLTDSHASIGARPSKALMLGWVWLAFLVSSASLGVTTYITTDVASMPLLWVIPLAIYLLSFVDAFRERPRFVPIAMRAMPAFALFTIIIYAIGGHGVLTTYLLHLGNFTLLAFALHGWLARLKPATKYLTLFYVLISVGGMLGGALNGLAAPLLLRDTLEYPIIVLLAALSGLYLLQRERSPLLTWIAYVRTMTKIIALGLLFCVLSYVAILHFVAKGDTPGLNSFYLIKAAAVAGIASILVWRSYMGMYGAAVTLCLCGLLAVVNGVVGHTTLFKDRNFFGVSRVYQHEAMNARYYMHGTTLHGVQSLDPQQALKPQAYYAAIVPLFDRIPMLRTEPFAIVGLGVGTLKCLAQQGQEVDLFEIDPLVRDIALDTRYFTYLSDCPGTHELYMGDGRIRIAQQPDGHYGAIVIDVFSSDAIPTHLLTHEALAIYLSKLTPSGVLMINTTNRHVDLWPMLGNQAASLNVVAYGKPFFTSPDKPLWKSSYWVVMARDEASLAPVIEGQEGWQKLTPDGKRVWTDSYTNLLPYFKLLR